MLQAFLLRAYKAKQKSGFSDKPFFALGAGDGDFTFVPGEPDSLAAPGTGKIAVFFILYLIAQTQIPAVFLVALVGISGEGTEIGPEQKHKSQGGQDHLHQGIADKQGNQTQHHTHTQNGIIELVIAVAACHEPAKAGIEFHREISEEIAESVHTKGLLGNWNNNIIMQKSLISTGYKHC